MSRDLCFNPTPLAAQNKPSETTNERPATYGRGQQSREGTTSPFSFTHWLVEGSPREESNTLDGLGNTLLQVHDKPTGLHGSDDALTESSEQVGSQHLPDRSILTPSTIDTHNRIPLRVSSAERLEVEEDSNYRSLCQSPIETDDEERTQNVDSHNTSNDEQIEVGRQTKSYEGPIARSEDESSRRLGSPRRYSDFPADGETGADAVEVNNLDEHIADSSTNDQRSRQAEVVETGNVVTVKTGCKRKRTREKMLFEEESTLLEPYILWEKWRCEKLGLPSSEGCLKKEEAKEQITRLHLGKYIDLIRIFVCTVASCGSLVVLQDVLRAYRNPVANAEPRNLLGLSNAQRLEIIRNLGGSAAYFNLLRMCHIHRLFTENSDPRREANGAFIINTAENIASHAKRQRGNPVNNAEARITKAMMQEVFPEMEEHSAGYTSKYNEISELRRLGRRLDILVTTFGSGILGLLPLSKKTSMEGVAANITDSMQVSSTSLSPTELTVK